MAAQRPTLWFGRWLGIGLMAGIFVLLSWQLRAEPPEAILGQPLSEYQARRSALQAEVGEALVVIFGASSEDFNEFQRFRQSNDFLYLSGIERPGAILVLVPESLCPKGQEGAWAFLPAISRFEERWTGPQDGPGDASARKFGLDEVQHPQRFYPRLLEILARGSDDDGSSALPALTVFTHTARGRGGERERVSEFAETLQRIAPSVRIENVAPKLAALRLVKSESETRVLQRAIDITIEAHRDASRAIQPGAFEYEAQAALEAAFTRNGAQRPGFFSIVGSGPNSTIPHYNANRRRMECGDLVVVDIGAEVDYYTADITRTYPVSGRFSDRQREVYQLVLDAQRAAEEAFEPGKSRIRDLQHAAIQCMRASPLRDSEGRSLDRYFTHGLGHWLGMAVHDVGDYSQPIPPGAVFTIEPGIYIAEEDLGVRIEDNYLATEDGLVKLSAELPSEPDEIEEMMALALQAAGQD